MKEREPAMSITDGVIKYGQLSETTVHIIFDMIFKNVFAPNMMMTMPFTESQLRQYRFDSMALMPIASNNNQTQQQQAVPFVDKKPWRFIIVDPEAFGNNNEWFFKWMYDFVRALVPVDDGSNNTLNFDPAIRITLPFVQGQPRETILFSIEAWSQFVFSVFYILVCLASMHHSASSPSSSSRITEIFSDDELANSNTSDSSSNYAADNSSDDSSDDSESDIDYSTLDTRLFDLYNKNK